MGCVATGVGNCVVDVGVAGGCMGAGGEDDDDALHGVGRRVLRCCRTADEGIRVGVCCWSIVLDGTW